MANGGDLANSGGRSSSLPDTRYTMVEGLRSESPTKARQSWDRFVGGYEPFLTAYARRLGVREADLEDLMQDVYLRVHRALDRFELDPAAGRFRSWLFTIVRNRAYNYFRTRGRKPGNHSGAVEWDEIIDRMPSNDRTQGAMWKEDFQRHLFDWACRQVRPNVAPQSWQAFWRTSVEEEDPEEVAIDLKMTRGAVYVARSRVTSKIRDAVSSPPANF